ncbi:hypothetical protein HUE87_02855 [Candidatus Sulfurimonas marisnigri]|uniref:Uncharacterized protein n=1 Tax=Candidatus Sulfurimonas marisnigri TaxID=2740405 RepID=A0A7S7M1B0_9BACT|nr:hypothetical protein [Candidatus Sulfurimonas marisnigri]QOY55195.1 hypothetical protein HUE87_02855 [Candidatus Sulfurimonas marisnigri]
MSKFYFLLWLKWAARLVTCSIILAYAITIIITSFIYYSSSMPTFNSEVFQALRDILEFWFPIVWSVTLLLALFRGMKYIFNTCINGYEFKLLNCKSDETIEIIGYGDLVKVWRKWFMLIIWLVGSIMVLSIAYTSIFTSFSGIFEWFSIYWLFCFILLSGYFSFIILGSRCKRVKIVKC